VDFAGHYNFWIAILLMMIGLYPVMARTNLVKRIIGLSLFQTGIFLLYISMGKIYGGTAPVHNDGVPLLADGSRNPALYTNAIPTALILTGIVVSVSTLAVALAIVVCIKREYGTIEMDDIEKAENGDPK
jgi:multicomponent Na+:H+ antiporter subunit C